MDGTKKLSPGLRLGGAEELSTFRRSNAGESATSAWVICHRGGRAALRQGAHQDLAVSSDQP